MNFLAHATSHKKAHELTFLRLYFFLYVFKGKLDGFENKELAATEATVGER